MRKAREDSHTEALDADDAPELTGAELDHPEGQWRQGGKIISAAQGRAAFRERLSKKQVNMLLDADVLDYFRQKAGGRGYQTLINRTLRESMERDSLLDAVRQAVREEMRHHE
ncbi:BrnA antitoxin family protein [Acidithiobacillus sp. CV18-2]|nr:BrnA antitoxin family protein [Acidithiobacillus sp. CV18-3]MBU2756912.1 BrnA antitoxin family protein [Acidithiobacillus sp. BN09-2]MBU2777990.1 BrnA antitoxin family protein [Acidithiobacillus sp. CV18-2]MBU2799623.1 BrnA antitoxin family protein [Acidithiobacillus sp. VAN18-4]